MERIIRVLLATVVMGSSSLLVYAQVRNTTMKLTSPVFDNNEIIPKKYTCQGIDVNPPLEISHIPEGTKSLALVIDDPDAPGGTWVHWVVFDIPVSKKIEEASIPGKQGGNDFGKQSYGGPCPPLGTHRYFFRIYALDTTLELQEGLSKGKLEKAMEEHILAQAELVGLYKKI